MKPLGPLNYSTEVRNICWIQICVVKKQCIQQNPLINVVIIPLNLKSNRERSGCCNKQSVPQIWRSELKNYSRCKALGSEKQIDQLQILVHLLR